MNSFSDDELRQIVEAVNAAGGVKTEAAKSLNVSPDRVKRGLKRAAERGLVPFKPVMPGFMVKEVTSKAADGSFVKQVRESGETFQPMEGQKIKRVSAFVDEENRVRHQWIITAPDNDAHNVLVEQIKKSITEATGHATLPPAPAFTNDQLLAFYPIADVHLGAFAWGKETGNDYDLQIAERILKDSTGELISRSAPADTAVIVDLGDFFHGDNTRNQTSKSGNPLDIDTRHPKVVQTGFMAVVWIIEMALQKHQRVIYRKLAGNHDEETSPTFALGIWAYFRDNPRVEVDISPARAFTHRFGKTLLAATHGDMMKMTELASWLAAAHPKDWGESEYRYGWTGHVHNRNAITPPGMAGCESLNSPAARDAWHAGMGFHSPRTMISVTYDRERGERDRLTVNIRG